MKDSNDFDPEATRLARVNPVTGEEEVAGALAQCASSSNPDMTVLHEIDATSPPSKKTTEVIPVTGARAAGEATTVWEQEKRQIALGEIPGRLRLYLSSSRRRRVILLALSPLFVGLALFSVSRNEAAPVPSYSTELEQTAPTPKERTKDASAPEAPPATVEPGLVLEAVPPSKTQEFPRKETKSSDELKEAISALLDGRLDEARRRYATLEETMPEDESVRLASRILARLKVEDER